MKDVEFIYHACGHRKKRKLFGTPVMRQLQRDRIRSTRCSTCEGDYKIKQQSQQEPPPAMAY